MHTIISFFAWFNESCAVQNGCRYLRSKTAILRHWANIHDSGDKVPVSDMYGNPGTTCSHWTDIVYLKFDELFEYNYFY